MTMRRFPRTAVLSVLVLLLAGSAHGFGYVTWEDYRFTISDGTAVLRRNGVVLAIGDRSRVRVVANHLLIDGAGSAPAIDLMVSDGVVLAISREFQRDDAAQEGGRPRLRVATQSTMPATVVPGTPVSATTPTAAVSATTVPATTGR